MFGVVVAGGHGLHVGEAGHGNRRDGGFRAAGNNGVGLAALDNFVGIADGVGASRAGGDGALARPLRAQHLGDIARSHVGDHHGNKERADAAHAAFHQFAVLVFKGLNAADAAADEDADTGAVVVGDGEAGIRQSHLGGGGGELREAIHALGVFAVQIVFRLEAFDLGGNAGGNGGAVKVVTRLTPLRPARSPCQYSSVPMPSGVIAPRPGITTRRSFAIIASDKTRRQKPAARCSGPRQQRARYTPQSATWTSRLCS